MYILFQESDKEILNTYCEFSSQNSKFYASGDETVLPLR